jgi:hypothetical protein
MELAVNNALAKQWDQRRMKQMGNLAYYTIRSFACYTGHIILIG